VFCGAQRKALSWAIAYHLRLHLLTKVQIHSLIWEAAVRQIRRSSGRSRSDTHPLHWLDTRTRNSQHSLNCKSMCNVFPIVRPTAPASETGEDKRICFCNFAVC
jgi:hypothetical protein